jgi:hypothetical protein
MEQCHSIPFTLSNRHHMLNRSNKASTLLSLNFTPLLPGMLSEWTQLLQQLGLGSLTANIGSPLEVDMCWFLQEFFEQICWAFW